MPGLRRTGPIAATNRRLRSAIEATEWRALQDSNLRPSA
jgi:hypothetical protein